MLHLSSKVYCKIEKKGIRDKIRAFVRGWRTRKIMQTCEVFTQTKHIIELNRMAGMNEGIKEMRKKAVIARGQMILRFFKGEKRWTESYMGRIREKTTV